MNFPRDAIAFDPRGRGPSLRSERSRRKRIAACVGAGIAWIGGASGCFHEDGEVLRQDSESTGEAVSIGDSDVGGTSASVEPPGSDAGSDSDVDADTSGGSSTGAPVDCTLDIECDDDNPCTLDVCEAHDCRHIDLDALRTVDQVPGDCRTMVCAAGEALELADPSDLPDDHNDCTIDGCVGDTTSHDPAAAGLPCSGGAVCDGAGECDECASPDTCEQLPVDDDCQVRTCIDGACGQAFAPAGTPVNATLQTPGDCRRLVCDGAGATTQEPNPTDPTIDGLDCTGDVCTDDEPHNPPLPAGTSCAAGECNALGQCVGCNEPSDCGETVACQSRTCSAQGVCGVSNVAAGTPLPAGVQVDGDCQEVRCDGLGAAASVADDDDLPGDVDACTSEVCNGGLPQHPDEAPGTPCNEDGGTYCDGTGACVVCIIADDCPDAPACELAVCVAGACDTAPAMLGTACSDGLFCTATDACDGAGACVGTDDPCDGVDADDDCVESCDEVSNACNGVDPDDSPCDDGLACTTDDACEAGVCSGDPVRC